MTLVIATATPQELIVVADRVLSSDGVLVETNYSKSFTVHLPSARFIVSFTGVAKHEPSGFSVRDWLVSAFRDAAPRARDWRGALWDVAVRATREINGLPIPEAKRRLTIICVGYEYIWLERRSARWIRTISNFDDQGEEPRVSSLREFRIDDPSVGRAEEQGFAGAFGSASSRIDDSLRRISEQAHNGLSATGVVLAAVSAMRRYVRSENKQNTVGLNYSSLVIRPDPGAPATGSLHRVDMEPVLETSEAVFFDPNFNQKIAVTIPAIKLNLAAEALGFFAPIEGGARCPCGSGRQFRRCCKLRQGDYL